MYKIERFAVKYLYHSRDCEFANLLVDSANQELSSIACTVVENATDFLKAPK